MSVLTNIFHKTPPRHPENATVVKVDKKTKPVSEIFWFTTTFILFVIMGPFSAIAAVIGVFSCLPNNEKGVEPEPAKG